MSPLSINEHWPLTIAPIALFMSWLYFNSEGRKLRHIPTIGYSSPILSYISAFRFMFYAENMVNEGVKRFNDGPFKVPTLGRWMVVVHGDRHIEDFKKAPDDALSTDMAISESLQVPYTIGANILDNPYHISLIRTQLSRNLDNVIPELHKEVKDCCDELFSDSQEWKSVNAMNTSLDIICRLANRAFVGLPLCRDTEYLENCKSFTLDIIKDSVVLNLLPSFLRPIVHVFVRNTSRRVEICMKQLEPVITEYRAALGENPDNMLTWLIQTAQGDEQSSRCLTKRVLLLNFVAVHTTTHTLVQVLCNLVSNTRYIKALREEIEGVVEEKGWSRASLDDMKKLDSFIKETQRLGPLGVWQSSRIAVKDYTCKDGTLIPQGSIVSLAMDHTHRNSNNFPNPDQFEGFRFLNKDKNSSSSMVTLSPDYLSFGLGKHACPGRFFAANELKLFLAHFLLTYDLQLSGSSLPKLSTFGPARIPDMKAEILIRKRRT